ncbi:MAG: hypothetical protein SF053_13480 [Bacteroidia bacterium]|nr:hypothetical protein [Bacteroidia bacterium]
MMRKLILAGIFIAGISLPARAQNWVDVIKILPDLYSLWELTMGYDPGFVMITTDRKQGADLYIVDKSTEKRLGSTTPADPGAFKIKPGSYLIKAYDRNNRKFFWKEYVTVEEGEIFRLRLDDRNMLKDR